MRASVPRVTCPARRRMSAAHRGLSVARSRRRSGDSAGWMGHASIATTNLYLHYLGTSADRAGLARLNDRGRTGANGGRTLANDIGPIHRLLTRNA
jgi:hypothetical protein